MKEKKALEAQVRTLMHNPAVLVSISKRPSMSSAHGSDPPNWCPTVQVERLQKKAADAENAMAMRDQAVKEVNRESSRYVWCEVCGEPIATTRMGADQTAGISLVTFCVAQSDAHMMAKGQYVPHL